MPQRRCGGYDDGTVQVRFQPNASERYDVGLFIAMDGSQPPTGGAQFGDSCYHDFLQEASTTGPWDLTTGYGPFKSLDGDACADIVQDDGINYYYTQVPVTIACTDADNDGVVDPLSICTSYDNNAGGVCSTVKHGVSERPIQVLLPDS